jgi:hypothetical protein
MACASIRGHFYNEGIHVFGNAADVGDARFPRVSFLYCLVSLVIFFITVPVPVFAKNVKARNTLNGSVLRGCILRGNRKTVWVCREESSPLSDDVPVCVTDWMCQVPPLMSAAISTH